MSLARNDARGLQTYLLMGLVLLASWPPLAVMAQDDQPAREILLNDDDQVPVEQTFINLQEQELSASLTVGLEHSNNVRQTDVNRDSDTKAIVGLNLGYAKQARSVDIGLQYNVTRSDYLNDATLGTTETQGRSHVLFATYPERYSWTFEHIQDVDFTDSKGPDIPSNREERMTFITGPTASLRFGPVDRLQGSLRYIVTRFDSSTQNDSDRATGSLAWQHTFSQILSGAFTVGYSDVQFDEGSSDYNQWNAGLSFNRVLQLGMIGVEGGVSKIQRDMDEDVDGNYFNAYTRLTSGLNSLNLSYKYALTDSSVGLSLSGILVDFPSGDTNFQVSDLVVRRSAQLDYSRQLTEDKRVLLVYRMDEADYDTRLQDEERWQLGLSYLQSLSSRTNATFNYRYQEIKYLDDIPVNQDKRYSASFDLTHQLDSRVYLSFTLGYERRENDVYISREYDEAIAEARARVLLY